MMGRMSATKPKLRFPVLAAGAALFLLVLSFDAPADDGLPALFEDDTVLALRIEAPLRTLMQERSDTEYLDGYLYYTDAAGQQKQLDLKLRARGRYRRQQETCPFPPVRLNFRKKQVEGTVFDGADKLKLVTHCRNRNDQYEQNVLKEYLAYRIFNLLTDHSFRVRLLRIEYVDNDRGELIETRHAFLIEDDDLLGERIGASRAEIPRTAYEHIDPRQGALVAVFQYLIGNTDFSMIAGAKDDICCHNVVLFSDGSEQYIPVPYDFDFAGLVNARYAKPNPNLPIKRVTSRLYRGNCMHNAYVDDALSQITAQRQAVHDLMSAIPGLTDRSREVALRYIGDFFSTVTDPGDVEKRLLRKCS
jgi:hypothetical protein